VQKKFSFDSIITLNKVTKNTLGITVLENLLEKEQFFATYLSFKKEINYF